MSDKEHICIKNSQKLIIKQANFKMGKKLNRHLIKEDI